MNNQKWFKNQIYEFFFLKIKFILIFAKFWLYIFTKLNSFGQ